MRKVAQNEPHKVCLESITYLIAKRLIAINEADAVVVILFSCDIYVREV